MENKVKVYDDIQSIKSTISKSSEFFAAIDLHCRLISDEFEKKKLFYKYIFSNSRFIISTIVPSVFFSREEAYISTVTNECLKTGMVSPNTISSLLTLFKVSGRINLVNSKKDRRKKKYILTEKGKDDTLSLLNTMVPCLKLIFPCKGNPEILRRVHLPSFFKEFYKIHNSSLLLIKLVKNSDIFISKDSGHMVLVNLYMLGVKNIQTNENLSTIAKKCGVSRTHLKNIMSDAEKLNMLYIDNKNNKIYINDEFMQMFKEYMSYYFTFIKYGLNGIP